MPRHKETDRQSIQSQTRARLLAAAAIEFAQEGYHGANINRISLAAGFAKGTIYNYFPSKRALMLALIEDTAAHHVRFIVERLAEQSAPDRRLLLFFEAGFDFVMENLPPARTMIATLYGPDEAFRTHMYLAYQPLFQFVGEEIVAAGVSQGLFSTEDPASMATLLMTIYLGTSSQLDERGRTWLNARTVAEFSLRALRAPFRLPEESE